MSSAYHGKLVSLVKSSPDVEPDRLAEMIRKARAHAGGKAAAEKRRAAMNPEGMMTMSELRYFVELDKDGLTDWVKVAPGPGKWKHEKYGSIVVTPNQLSDYVDNFHNQVYQEHIPVDAEHKTKLSGALAYYRELKAEPDGLYAKLELTERGQKLLDGGGFKYFSPEFYDEWEDAATGKKYNNVLTGGAFTTRPFFKDKSLPPIQLCEMMPCCDECDDDEGEEDTGELTDIVQDMVFDGLTDEEISNGVQAAIAYARTMRTAYARAGAAGEGEGGMEMSEPYKFRDISAEERKKIAPEDFAGPGNTFPVDKPADVSAAAHLIGKAENPDAVKARIISIAKRKGDAFVNQLPDEWQQPKSASEDGVPDTTSPGDANTEDLAKQFTELSSKYAAVEAESKTFAEQNKQLTERIAAMEVADRRRSFTEMVTGRGGADDGGPQWFGEPETHVAMLEALHSAFGPDSDQYKAYVEQQRSVAKAMSESEAMKPKGKTSHTPTSTGDTVMGAIKAFSEERKLSIEKGTVEYLKEHPEQYQEYDREFMRASGQVK